MQLYRCGGVFLVIAAFCRPAASGYLRAEARRRRAPPCACCAPVPCTLSINVLHGTTQKDRDKTKSALLTFERLLKVKPFPAECPYEGTLDLFDAAEPLNLQPPPSRAATTALQRLYKDLLAKPRMEKVLEHVCDGASRLPEESGLPWLQKRRTPTQLHASAPSCAAATAIKDASHSRYVHTVVPELQLPPVGTPEWAPTYALEQPDGQFDAILSHQCVPYAVAPLPLFTELHRILRPSGTLCVTFEAPPPPGAAPRWAQHAACDPRSASLAWLQAADAADLLYMVSSFFFYSGGWSDLEVSELLPHSPSSPTPLYCVRATKLSNRALMVLRTERDPTRISRFSLLSSAAKAEQAAAKAEQAAAKAAPPPPPSAPRARRRTSARRTAAARSAATAGRRTRRAGTAPAAAAAAAAVAIAPNAAAARAGQAGCVVRRPPKDPRHDAPWDRGESRARGRPRGG